jgi:hypothetical protein
LYSNYQNISSKIHLNGSVDEAGRNFGEKKDMLLEEQEYWGE